MALVGAPAPELAVTDAKTAAKADLERLLAAEDIAEESDDESYKDESEIDEDIDAEGDDAAEGEQEDSMEESDSEAEAEEVDEQIEMEEVADLVTDAEIPLDYSKDGIFNPTQVLRSGKQVFSELRATTIEKGEFESDDEEDSEYEESDSESDIIVEDQDEVEAEETAEADADEEEEEVEFDEPITTEEIKEIVTESKVASAPLKSSRILRNNKEIQVDENVEDLSAKIQEMLSGGLDA